MLDLTFFSTNATKIAHFRYISAKFGLRIKSFREVNYYASYSEPRIDDRDELLKQSYFSALSQWKKRQRRQDDGTNTFFFEDTSVRIEALSHDVETPGVNVKFWMKDMSFSKLDEILKRHGGDRRATVRSDIVMHLPQRWKDLLGMTDDFIWFYGETKGEICLTEQNIESNLLFTWLDDKSFNKWFIPEGASKPLSAMKIAEADIYDFRRRAFEKVGQVLDKLKFIQSKFVSSNKQMELPKIPVLPAVIVICGPSCAGKTTIATWINDMYGIPHIEASDFMYKAFWERHGLRSKYSIGDFAVAALESQPDIVALPIAKYIHEENFSIVIVTGFRSLDEVKIFREELPEDMKLELVYLNAKKEIRLARAIKRNRDKITSEKFFYRDVQEEKMGLLNISKYEKTVSIDNDFGINDLHLEFRRRFKTTFSLQNLVAQREKFESNLEALIIITLFNNINSAKWLNTSEISVSLNELFGESKRKTNVSRYFNQEYHPYFESKLRTYEGRATTTIEYSLSATGISKAKIIREHYSKWLARKSPEKTIVTQLSLFPD